MGGCTSLTPAGNEDGICPECSPNVLPDILPGQSCACESPFVGLEERMKKFAEEEQTRQNPLSYAGVVKDERSRQRDR